MVVFIYDDNVVAAAAIRWAQSPNLRRIMEIQWPSPGDIRSVTARRGALAEEANAKMATDVGLR